MGKYWLKIGLGAMLIFGVGMGFISMGRHIKHGIESAKDITIPLGGFIPFSVEGNEVGKLRSVTIHRNETRMITGFGVSVRVSDSSVLDRYQSCRFSVADPSHIDENTSFSCLSDSTGFQEFGEVRLSIRSSGETRTLIVPLLLPETTVRDIQHRGTAPGESVADSLMPGLEDRVRAKEQAYNDSVTAARLEKRAKDMQRQADSLRGKAPIPPPKTPTKP